MLMPRIISHFQLKKVKEWYIIKPPNRKLLNKIFLMFGLGVFQYIRDILQVTVQIYHPVEGVGSVDNRPSID